MMNRYHVKKARLGQRTDPFNDAVTLMDRMARTRAAVLTVPALAEATGWTRDRVADALAVAVEAGQLDEWPEYPAGPAVMLAKPERFGLRLAVAGEVDALTYAWVAADEDPADPRWAADRDRRRKKTRTIGEGAAIAAGWARPLDSIPDPSQFDPAMIAEHREELERAMAGEMVTGRHLLANLPASPHGAPYIEPGRPHKRHEAGHKEERDAWLLLALGSAWSSCAPIPTISRNRCRKNLPPDLRPEPITTARPDNLRAPGVASGCPHCRGAELAAASYCTYCDRSGVDAVVAVPREVLEATAAREVVRLDRDRAAYEKAAEEQRAKRRERDRKRKERGA